MKVDFMKFMRENRESKILSFHNGRMTLLKPLNKSTVEDKIKK